MLFTSGSFVITEMDLIIDVSESILFENFKYKKNDDIIKKYDKYFNEHLEEFKEFIDKLIVAAKTQNVLIHTKDSNLSPALFIIKEYVDGKMFFCRWQAIRGSDIVCFGDTADYKRTCPYKTIEDRESSESYCTEYLPKR